MKAIRTSSRMTPRWAGRLAALVSLLAAAVTAAAQPIYSSAPAGLKLEIRSGAIDLSKAAEQSLQVQLVNGTRQSFVLDMAKPLGILELQLVGPKPVEAVVALCEFDPSVLRSLGKDITLAAGESYTIALPMSQAICRDEATGYGPPTEARLRTVISLGGAGPAYAYGVAVDSNWVEVKGTLPDTDQIRMVLRTQEMFWNEGLLEDFARGYKNSPDILFIGRKVSRGYDQMLASYKHGYATREQMGTLTFSQLEVQPLDPRFATATGHYHLERTAAGGGNADGYFLLVLENTASGWKIVRDDTTSLPPPAKP